MISSLLVLIIINIKTWNSFFRSVGSSWARAPCFCLQSQGGALDIAVLLSHANWLIYWVWLTWRCIISGYIIAQNIIDGEETKTKYGEGLCNGTVSSFPMTLLKENSERGFCTCVFFFFFLALGHSSFSCVRKSLQITSNYKTSGRNYIESNWCKDAHKEKNVEYPRIISNSSCKWYFRFVNGRWKEKLAKSLCVLHIYG